MSARQSFQRTDTSGELPRATNTAEDAVDSKPRQMSAAEVGLDEKDPVYAEVANISEVEANDKLAKFRALHRWDPNLSDEAFDAIDDAHDTRDIKNEAHLVGEFVENSPYPEVRAVVRNYDEECPSNTIRAWTIGMVLGTIASALNMLFSMRNPSISIGVYVIQLVAYPIGLGWAKVMPDREFNCFGVKFNLSPGKFNIKEHTIIIIMANAAFANTGYFTDTLIAIEKFYGFTYGWGFNICLALSTQCVGFGIAGLTRRYLVESASAIWPSNLVNVAFMYALHDHTPSDPSKTNGWSIGRYRWFLYVFTGSFIWYWFPGVIFQGLTYFAFVTWIKPNNPVVNQLFGQYTGISLLPITFDWTNIAGYIASPLIAPWHAIANIALGTTFFFQLITCAIHYSGVWYGQYLPISDNHVWDNTQNIYNTSKVLTPEYTVDPAKFEAYSPLFLSTTFGLTYGLSFASIAALISHVAVFHGREIWMRFRMQQGEMDDIHMKMMRKYPLVPIWWFMSVLVVMIGFSFATIYAWPTHLTWWALILAFVISAVWIIPIGLIQAFTNIQLGLNVFTEFIIGYALPGRPLAMMLFKTYGYITMTQGLAFAQDQKLAHYLKVPQRSTFWSQFVATIWCCFVQLAVLRWSYGAIDDICSSDQKNSFTCPNGRTFYNASIIWGVVGPKHMFSPGAIYVNLQYFWIAGFITPIIVYFLATKWPKSNIRFFSAPLFFGGMGYIPPASPVNYLTWSIVGFVFNKYIRNKYRGWWMRYNYVTSAGLDCGLAICTILIFFTITLTNTTIPQWFGNVGVWETMDMMGEAIQTTIPVGTTFGPKTWKW